MKHLYAFCLGIVLSFTAFEAEFLILTIATIVSLTAYRLLAKIKMEWLIALFLGALYATAFVHHQISHRLSVDQTGEAQVTFQVVELPQKFDWGVRFRADVVHSDRSIRTILINDYQARDWPLESVWKGSLYLKAPVGRVNSVGFNRENWALSEGIDAFANAPSKRQAIQSSQSVFHFQSLRQRIHQRILRVGEHYPQGAALIAALSVGMTDNISDSMWEKFRRWGITHLVSISGLHISMVALLSLFLVRQILRWMGRVVPIRNIYESALAISVLIAMIYAILAGFSIPTQRSVLMVSIAALAMSVRQMLTVGQIWAITLFVVLVISPVAVLSVGFWLSFGLVAALIWATGSLYRAQSNKMRLFVRTQYTASVASIVPLGLFFSQFPLLSPIVNAIAIPIFSIFITPFALISLIIPFDMPLWSVIVATQKVFDFLLTAFGDSPMLPISHSPFMLALLALISCAIIIMPRGTGLKPFALIILMFFLFFPGKRLPDGVMQARIYDVGQGLAVLLRTADHQLLFDTGNVDIRDVLFAEGVRHLDTMVLSHHDDDHDAMAMTIHRAFNPDTVWAGMPQSYDFSAQHCTDGMAWTWNNVWFEFLTPSDEKSEVDDNQRSCVLRVLAGDGALLLVGDITQHEEMKLIEKYGENLYSTHLVLSHHGSKSSNSSAFLNRVDPSEAIVSSGFANGYRHPHSIVLKRLKGVHISRTDLQGALTFTLPQEKQVSRVKKYRFYWQQKPQ